MFIYKPNKVDQLKANGILITKAGYESKTKIAGLTALVSAGILTMESVDEKELQKQAEKERAEAKAAQKKAEDLAKQAAKAQLEAEAAQEEANKETEEAEVAEEKVSKRSKKRNK